MHILFYRHAQGNESLDAVSANGISLLQVGYLMYPKGEVERLLWFRADEEISGGQLVRTVCDSACVCARTMFSLEYFTAYKSHPNLNNYHILKHENHFQGRTVTYVHSHQPRTAK